MTTDENLMVKLEGAYLARTSVQLTASEVARAMELIDLSSAETAQALREGLAQTRSLQSRLHARVQANESRLAKCDPYTIGYANGFAACRNPGIEAQKELGTVQRRLGAARNEIKALRDYVTRHLNPSWGVMVNYKVGDRITVDGVPCVITRAL
jgi:BMFP domain-containing protein YqiC